MADNKLTKDKQSADSKKQKKLTVEEQQPKNKTKAAPQKKAEKKATKGDAAFPLRYVFAAFCALLLLTFVSVAFTNDGLILKWLVSFLCGVFGKAVYYVSMPVLAYLIWIQLASSGKKVRRRSFCMVMFVLLCGCITHAFQAPDMTAVGWDAIVERYNSGIAGSSGGVLCGLITDLLMKGFGRFFILCTLLILAALCLFVGVRKNPLGWVRDQLLLVRNAAVKLGDYLQKRKEQAELLPDSDSPGLLNRLTERAAQARLERRERRKLESGKEESRNRFVNFVNHFGEDEDDFEDDYEPIAPEPLVIPPSDLDVVADVAVEPGVPAKKQVTAKEAAQSAVLVEQEIAAAQSAPKMDYSFPPIDLLQRSRGRAADGTAEMKENTLRLNESLASYKIDAHISNVTRGPSVTRYEVELEKGVRLNKLTSCADDIALSLGASGVRIAPVPGKISVVGIEVPNQAVTTVPLREVIDSPEFSRAASHSSIAVGKDIGGACIVGNIAKFPHMLIAGTTGSGKSVCMNSIIISILYKASPEDVKLIMIDPKMVELGIYNGIPHLLIPVVTDPKKAAGSLQWAVTEMMRRYRSMSDAGVRDLESYNSMIDGGEIEGERLPQVVVIIDELADLMLVAAKEVEESICRIAQMGRAAGIHLIIATQRPSADVITGLMKANIPSRIAFSVASAMESRIILDTQGAEKLVGKGDMLYSPIGSGKPQRVQGCFVTDSEVEAVTNYVKEHFATTYDQSVMDDIERKAEQTGTRGGHATASDPDPSADELAHDEMLPDAVEVILETKQASVSLLQRRLKLGYARAARIVDEMEEMGIVGPFVGSKPRQILITKEQWDQMKQGQTIVTQPAPAVEEEIDIPF